MPTHCLRTFFACALLGGCAFDSYQAWPLDPEQIVAELTELRRTTRLDEPVTLAEATRWLLDGPDVRSALAELAVARATAEIATPLPNPSIEFGAEFGLDGNTPSERTVPFGGLGVTIPLGDRRACNDAVAAAELALAETAARCAMRTAWLELRAAFAETALGSRRADALQAAEAAATTAVQLGDRLVEAGGAATDRVAALELELANTIAERLAFEAHLTEQRRDLAIRTATSLQEWHHLTTPAAFEMTELPDATGLRAALIAHHTELRELRRRYEVAEAELHLAVAEQYPDLQIGPSVGGEVGETRTVLGLTLGIELPIFDRNQRAIATARARRQAVREQYELAAHRALTELEAATRQLELAVRRLELHEQRIVPAAERALQLATRAIEAGSGDLLALLQSAQAARAAQLQFLDAERDLIRAWNALELATGTPLIDFSSNREPSLPDGDSR